MLFTLKDSSGNKIAQWLKQSNNTGKLVNAGQVRSSCWWLILTDHIYKVMQSCHITQFTTSDDWKLQIIFSLTARGFEIDE
jgi:hypothetical protein